MKQSTRFRHESLQDQDTIQRLLRALTNGIGKGKVVLEDEDGTLVMEPGELITLKISADQDEDKSRLNIRLTWAEDRAPLKKKSIKIKGK